MYIKFQINEYQVFNKLKCKVSDYMWLKIWNYGFIFEAFCQFLYDSFSIACNHIGLLVGNSACYHQKIQRGWNRCMDIKSFIL